MNKGRVLVTGADGFIGSHLTEALVRSGTPVRAFVQYNAFNSWGWLDNSDAEVRDAIEIFSGDLRDPAGVREAVSGCERVAHLGALIAIPYSYHSPATYVDTNITGTLNILQASKDLDVSRVVHTSTSEVYGSATYVPMDEQHPLKAQSPYAASKIGADQIALSFYRSFATPITVIRPFNTYGPRQSARAVIPTIITQLLSGKRSIKLGAVTPTRDFNYVSDTVSAFMTMLESVGVEGEVVNFGSGHEISVERAAQIIARTIGTDLVIETDEQRLRPKDSEVDRLCANHDLATRLTGWTPGYAGDDGFARGIADTVEWFRRDEMLERYKADQYNL